MKGSRGRASRLGTPGSGISAHVRGWDVGVKVYGYVQDGRDAFDIHLTGGSHDASGRVMIGRVTLDADGRPTFEPDRTA